MMSIDEYVKELNSLPYSVILEIYRKLEEQQLIQQLRMSSDTLSNMKEELE